MSVDALCEVQCEGEGGIFEMVPCRRCADFGAQRSTENKQLRLGWLYNTCHQLLTEAAIKPLDSPGDYVHHQGRHHNNNQVADEFPTLL